MRDGKEWTAGWLVRPATPHPNVCCEPAGDVHAKGRVGRIIFWSRTDDSEGRPTEFLFSVDAANARPPCGGYFAIDLSTARAEGLVRLIRLAAEHGWLVCASGKLRPGTPVCDLYDLYTEL